jgi:hypothetical protein
MQFEHDNKYLFTPPFFPGNKFYCKIIDFFRSCLSILSLLKLLFLQKVDQHCFETYYGSSILKSMKW